jgi:hypothetical protein
MPLVDAEFDLDLCLHRLDVQRQIGAARDAQGAIVEQWQTVYSGLDGTAIVRAGGKNEEFEQQVMTYPYDVYLRPLADGTMPDIRVGDRIPFGTWPGGVPRYIAVTDAINVLDADVIVQVTGTSRRPG